MMSKEIEVICGSFIEGLGYDKTFVFVLCYNDNISDAKNNAEIFTSLNKNKNWHISIQAENRPLWNGEAIDGLIRWEEIQYAPSDSP
jgi:hypothetical protein